MKPIGPRLAMSLVVLTVYSTRSGAPLISPRRALARSRPIMIRPAARPGLGRAAASTSDTADRGASAGRPVGPREARWSKPAWRWRVGRRSVRADLTVRLSRPCLAVARRSGWRWCLRGWVSRPRGIRLVHIGRHFVEAACGTVAVGIAGHRNPVCLAGGIRQTPTTGVAH